MKLSALDQKLQENPEYVQAMDDLKLHFELANAVLRARLQKGWSQTELARAVGTKQANISRIEAGLANPTMTLLRKLSQALDLEIRIVSYSAPGSQPEYSTSTSQKVVNSVIRVDNWSTYRTSETQYRQILDSSAEGEGYHV
jgi:transcriptional regulator with XRE-family HTH domain